MEKKKVLTSLILPLAVNRVLKPTSSTVDSFIGSVINDGIDRFTLSTDIC